MAFENKPGTGILFVNERKKSDNHPDYKGSFYEKVGDRVIERDLAGWKRIGKDSGKPYLSLKVTDKFVPKSSHAEASSEKPERQLDPDDPLPF